MVRNINNWFCIKSKKGIEQSNNEEQKSIFGSIKRIPYYKKRENGFIIANNENKAKEVLAK